MNMWPKYPLIYEVNTRVWLNDLSQNTNQPVTLGNVPQSELDRLAGYGFDALWLMGVWQRSSAAQQVALEHAGLRAEYHRILSDFSTEDVVGSPYAIYCYEVNRDLGDDEELAVLRERLKKSGLRLILDFVPNHLAVDHPWVSCYPNRFVRASLDSLDKNPQDYFCKETDGHTQVFAHGRDPYFDAWKDTIQLDYRNPDTREAMSDTLMKVAERCDGVRCDMAMLVTRDLFLRTWGGEFNPRKAEFWPAAIDRVKERYPDFLMLAEVYWEMEGHLQKSGFDYTYDKRLYDRLRYGDAGQLYQHLSANIDFQSHLARFIENHDEDRARSAFGRERSMAAATVAFSLPGLRLLHEGQVEGRTLKLPIQLGRRPSETPDQDLESFYRQLLDTLRHPVFQEGDWRLLAPRQAWAGNDSHHNFVAYIWALEDEIRLLAVNLGSSRAQCYVPLDLPALAERSWQLKDMLSNAHYVRNGRELLEPGLYMDVPGYGYHIFRIEPGSKEVPTGLQCLCTLRGHKEGIYGIAWSPDGQVLASAGEEKKIFLWNPMQCSSLDQLEGHTDVVSSVAWSPDSRMLASGSNDNTVRIWDINSRTLRHTLEGHLDNIVSVSWSIDGQVLASGSCDWRIIIWDVVTGKQIKILDKHTQPVNSVAWSPDGHMLACGSGDGTISLWDVGTYDLNLLIKERDWVSCVAWSADNTLIITGTGDGTIGVWDVETGQQKAILKGHTDRILHVSFVFDDRLLISKSADDTLRFWQSHTWNEVAVLKEEYGIYLTGVVSHPTESLLATRDDKENVIRIWELNAQALLNNAAPSQSVRYTNAKVVLVGESGVGKSCLAGLWRESHSPRCPRLTA